MAVASTVRRISLAGIALLAGIATVGFGRSGREINWKPITDALLKVTGTRPVKLWGVFQDEKKKQRLLVQFGPRYLALDTKAQTVYELPAAEIKPRGRSIESPDPATAGRLLPSSNWDMRNIGPAERVRVHLTEEGINLEVQLPHPIDYRAVY